MAVTIVHGDCRHKMHDLADASVQCVVTSPPYFWLRDYGVDGQIGHEDTVADFVAELVAVFNAVWPKLKDDGVVWLNLGDSYYSGNGQPTGSDPRSSSRNFMRTKKRPLDQGGWDIPKKSLCGIPWLVALAMQKAGWTLRADVIWTRPTALPEPSVKDRPHRQHEYVFLFSKSRRYTFNRAALPEESVWHIGHQRGLDGHNAAFPLELAERCILAGSNRGDLVLDPFAGSGTVGVACQKTGRDAHLIELSPAFVEVAHSRIGSDLLGWAAA